MLVDFKNKVLTIHQGRELKPHQKSQLGFWGFKRSEEDYKVLADEPSTLLLKVIDYFEKEKIPYSLNKDCKELLGKIKSRKDDFETIRHTGEEYKDGIYQKGVLLEFTNFLKNISPRPLKNHQIKAATHLYLVQNGANFSVPGSGKTAVVISIYEKLRREGKINTLFVIGPPSCFQPWKDEFKITLNRQPRYQILAGGDPESRKSVYFKEVRKKPELYLTTFQSLLQDLNDVIIFMRRNGVEIFLVIDEAHYIKRIEGNWARAVLNLSKYAKFRCVLTGTPMPRSYTDIFNLFDFLWPDNNPIDINTKIKIQQLEEKNKNEEIRKILKRNIGPLFYRVRKSELRLRSPIFHEPVVLKMNQYEKRLYDAIENRIMEYSREDNLRNISLVKKLRRGRMIRLRQCVSYAKLLLTAIENYEEELIESNSDLIEIIQRYDEIEVPAKLEYLLSFVQKMQRKKQKVIIWSNFIKTIELIVQTLSKKNIYCKLIYGKTPIEQESVSEEDTREKIRKEFIDPASGLDVLVVNPAACAESISLHTTCHSSLYYDLSYNCAQYLQSLDRIHRVGGSENVCTNYYFLQYKNTIDQDIAQNLNDKAKKMNDLIEEDYNIYSLDMVEEDEDEQAFIRLFG